MERLLEIFLWLIILLPILLLAVLAQVRNEEAREEWKNEQERLERIKALYPDPPSYEERMGVRYGPQRASGATGGTENG